MPLDLFRDKCVQFEIDEYDFRLLKESHMALHSILSNSPKYYQRYQQVH